MIRIKKRKGCCIFSFDCDELNKKSVATIQEHAQTLPITTKIGLNFENIERVDESFFEFVKTQATGRISAIISPKTSMLTYFSLRKTINLTPVYLGMEDFLANRRQIIKRDFKLVS